MTEPNDEQMTEADVRETIIRPFLHSLGYKQFTDNNIRTEVPLRYPRLFLGRKKTSDPPLRGKADYICEVLSHGRWVVEAKASSVDISPADVEQAHSYAAHPEVRALYFLVTNGWCFRLYAVSGSDEPILEWTPQSQDSVWVNIQNFLSPAAVIQRSKLVRPAPGKALAIGIGPEARLVGGLLTYDRYDANDAHFAAAVQQMIGHRATVVGDVVRRDSEGMICATLRLAGPNSEWDRLNKLAGYDAFEFRTADEYVSTDPEQPTIFQNLITSVIPAGTHVGGLPGLPPGGLTVPFDLKCAAFTQAAGFLDGKRLVGYFDIEYAMELPEQSLPLGSNRFQVMRSGGEVTINLE
jgi:hypothetical protein